jgi:hypothetical protein
MVSSLSWSMSFFQIVGLDLAEVEGNAALAQGLVHVVAGLRRDQPRQPHSGAQHL